MDEGCSEAGWYVIRRTADGAISCLYTSGHGWWAMAGHNRRKLPKGWVVAHRVDDLLNLAEGFKLTRSETDPRTING